MTDVNSVQQIFAELALDDFEEDSSHGLMKHGGQALVLPVVRKNGQRGVFRCLKMDADETAVARFRREIPILEKIDHPGVLKRTFRSASETFA